MRYTWVSTAGAPLRSSKNSPAPGTRRRARVSSANSSKSSSCSSSATARAEASTIVRIRSMAASSSSVMSVMRSPRCARPGGVCDACTVARQGEMK
ncbi:hypothetical protein ACWGLG_29080 [Streptomyces antimycoticus]